VGRLVLAIGLRNDPHVRAVGLAVSEIGGRYFVFDPSEDDFPTLSQAGDLLGCWNWKDGRSLNMEEVDSVFCRYAIDSLRPNDELPDLQKYAAFEQLQGALAPLRSIRPTRWMNDPWMEARSDCKVMQRNWARALGLRTPDQAISSNLDDIQAHLGSRAAIVKPISDASLGITMDGVFCERAITTDQFLAPYTAAFDIGQARAVRSDGTPLLVQEKIAKRADLRCMVVDQRVHAFAFFYKAGEPVDFRSSVTGFGEIVQLRSETKQALVALNFEMGIRYSACDLILSESGEEIFLEANVAGNWLFCDIHHDMAVTKDIAQRLCRH
jgi:glutathione synthase/RimK-type ligase-like ATP-grasp enzyme